ncbi:hypothetical protein Anapl_12069 [Anas platyrhynchos]|uniref:Uncharacterized protein n=1 Tax=Anas platyrhynchos TaxID=8839 RepID=R0KQW8_ANAPL|nr:hypothetical protein Anapl_12069 [Anas platyrhynchos]
MDHLTFLLPGKQGGGSIIMTLRPFEEPKVSPTTLKVQQPLKNILHTYKCNINSNQKTLKNDLKSCFGEETLPRYSMMHLQQAIPIHVMKCKPRFHPFIVSKSIRFEPAVKSTSPEADAPSSVEIKTTSFSVITGLESISRPRCRPCPILPASLLLCQRSLSRHSQRPAQTAQHLPRQRQTVVLKFSQSRIEINDAYLFSLTQRHAFLPGFVVPCTHGSGLGTNLEQGEKPRQPGSKRYPYPCFHSQLIISKPPTSNEVMEVTGSHPDYLTEEDALLEAPSPIPCPHILGDGSALAWLSLGCRGI